MKLSQLIESFVISNDEFEDYLNRATEQLVSELSSGKNPRDAVHDLALTFADQHNKSYDAYQRMAESLEARMHTLEMNSPTDMMNGPKDDMGMGSVDEPEMMSDPMGNMEMNAPASSEMPSDSDMEDYAAVMDNEQEVEESTMSESDDEKARRRALDLADEPERGEERKKVSLKKAPWEESVDEGIKDTVKAAGKKTKDVKEEKEDCRYCGGDCPNDEDHACDGYLGDIDGLYEVAKPDFAAIDGDEDEVEEAVEESAIDTVKAAGKKIGKATKKAKKFFGHGEHAAFDEFDDDEFDESVSESAIDTIRKIADEKSAMKIKFDNGAMMVDMFTASAVKSVYDNVNDANKEKLDNLMKTKEGMMKVANLSMKMLKEGRLDELFFLPAIGGALSGAAGAAGAVAGAARAAGAVAGAARAAGGLGKAAKVARAVSGATTISNAAGGLNNAFKDPTYKRATGKHLEHTDWRLEMKADDIMNSAIDKANKK
ncbi:hypothetical protein N9I00_01760 [bacterium]|nr:hypothetical protein [bacterium]